MLTVLNNLINVRNFLNLSINDLSVQMTSEKSNAISKKISILNSKILTMALLLDVDQIIRECNGEGEAIKSSYEIKNVEDLDKFSAAFDK